MISVENENRVSEDDFHCVDCVWWDKEALEKHQVQYCRVYGEYIYKNGTQFITSVFHKSCGIGRAYAKKIAECEQLSKALDQASKMFTEKCPDEYGYVNNCEKSGYTDEIICSRVDECLAECWRKYFLWKAGE
ncbi:MAG: hypothetical protein WCP79_06865 [Bacillota bacterium]